MNEILPVKARGETIPNLLKIIQTYEGEASRIKEEIVRYLQNESQRQKKPSPRILYFAVTIPTLRKLKLIEGEGVSIHLSPNGKRLADSYRSGGMQEFKRKFAYHLLQIDKANGDVTGILQKSPSLSIKELSDRVNSSGRTTLDRLRKWLNYLKFVDLVKFENEKVILRSSQLNACTEKEHLKVEEDKFVQTLINVYEEIRRENTGLVYVPIPMIRDGVCERFKDKGMWTWDFDEMLVSLPRETETYILQFTQPMERKEGGISIGNRYYYYLHIHKKGEE